MFGLGLAAGSFVSVLVLRLPAGRKVTTGRSRCPDCGRVLAWYDLVPLASYLALGGHCRHCRSRISIQYPLVEFYSGLVFVSSFKLFGQTPQWLFAAFLLEVFLVLFLIDLKHLILPSSVIGWGLAGAIGYGVLEKAGPTATAYRILSLENFLTAIGFLAVLSLIWLASGGRWLGLGDAKLMALVGLSFGLVGAVFVFYLAVLIGGVVGLIALAGRRGTLKTKLPLGAFICLAASVYLLTGLRLAQWINLNLIFR